MRRVKKQKYRILVADDEPAIRELLVAMLTGQGHVCDTAVDGNEALAKYSNNCYDAVITDIVMPGMDGLRLTSEIAAKGWNTPVMVITGFSEEHSAGKAVEAGANDFVCKPFSTEEFITRFHRMVRDGETLRQICDKQNQIGEMSHEMIAGVQRDASEKITKLEEEIKKLKAQLKS